MLNTGKQGVRDLASVHTIGEIQNGLGRIAGCWFDRGSSVLVGILPSELAAPNQVWVNFTLLAVQVSSNKLALRYEYAIFHKFFRKMNFFIPDATMNVPK